MIDYAFQVQDKENASEEEFLEALGVIRKHVPFPEILRLHALFSEAYALAHDCASLEDAEKQERLAQGLGNRIVKRVSRRLRALVSTVGMEPIVRMYDLDSGTGEFLLRLLTLGRGKIEAYKLNPTGRKFHD